MEEEEEEEDEAPLRLGTLSKESWCPDDTPQKSSTGRTPKGPTTKCLLCNMSVADNASSRCQHRRKSCMGTKHSFARRAEADKAASKAAAYARRHEDDEMHASVPQSAQGDGVSRPALETSAVAVPAIKSAKWFWWWVLRRLSAARLELLLRGLRWADGNQHSQGTADEPTGSPAIYTSSTSFRDEVMLACLHAGYAAVFKRKHKAGDIKTHGLQSAGSTTARDVTATVDGWIVMYSKNDTVRFPRLRRAEAVSPSEYHGPVWCVNVPPFNTIVVRRAATAQVTYDNGATLTVVSKASRPIIVGNCPFRMVDEINQGMDATNERRIFNQIVRSCEDVRIDDAGQRIEPPQSVEPNSVELKHMNKRDDDELSAWLPLTTHGCWFASCVYVLCLCRYFVVTPKLLPGLHYSPRVNVHLVFNGPRMTSQAEWDLGRFIRIAKSGKLAEATQRKKQRLREQQQLQAQTLGIGSQPSGSQMVEDS
jgi:hypothetical protein